MILLYQKIEDHLRDLIKNARDGDQLPTQTELSRRFRVNHLTTRRALSILERDGLIVRLRGKGTFVRKVRAAAPALNLVLLLPQRVERLAFWGQIFEGMLEPLHRLDLQLTVRRFSAPFSDLARSIRLGTAPGILAPFPAEEDMAILEDLHKEGHVVMVLNRVLESSPLNYVSTDHQAGMREMTARLLRRGHRRIGLIADNAASYCRQRVRGFEEALRAAGLAPDPRAVVKDVRGAMRQKHAASLNDGVARMLTRYRPTAVVALGSVYLEALREEAGRRGIRLDRDLDVATFDAVPDAVPEKPLIYQALQPFTEMGRVAISETNLLLRGSTARAEVKLPVRIIEPPGPPRR